MELFSEREPGVRVRQEEEFFEGEGQDIGKGC